MTRLPSVAVQPAEPVEAVSIKPLSDTAKYAVEARDRQWRAVVTSWRRYALKLRRQLKLVQERVAQLEEPPTVSSVPELRPELALNAALPTPQGVLRISRRGR